MAEQIIRGVMKKTKKDIVSTVQVGGKIIGKLIKVPKKVSKRVFK